MERAMIFVAALAAVAYAFGWSEVFWVATAVSIAILWRGRRT
jgi:hypothetical protein